MPTYSDICSNFTAFRESYPVSVQRQLEIIEEYFYFLGGAGQGDPFDLTSRSPIKGVVATEVLLGNGYDPYEDNAYFFTEFEEGELIVKALEKQAISKVTSSNNHSGSSTTSKSTSTTRPTKTNLLISGPFVDFDTDEIVNVCYKMVLMGHFTSIFELPNRLTTSEYTGGGLLPSPGCPVITPNPPPDVYGWFPVEPTEPIFPYWLNAGEGIAQTLPCIFPRRLKIRQIGIGVDVKTTNLENKREA